MSGKKTGATVRLLMLVLCLTLALTAGLYYKIKAQSATQYTSQVQARNNHSGWPPDDFHPRPDIAHMQELVDSSNKFGLEVLRHLVKAGGPNANVTLSPVSLSQAMYLMAFGARGETKDKLKSGLSISGDLNDIQTATQEWLKWIKDVQGVEVNIANSIWTKANLRISDEFQAIIHDSDAEINALAENNTEAVEQINDWVSSHTKGLIPQIVDRVPASGLVLANAVYFRGKWMHSFSLTDTKSADFTTADGSTRLCQLMSKKGEFQYASSDKEQVVRLPYDPYGELSMMIILPAKSISMSDYIMNFGEKSFAAIQAILSASNDAEQGTVQIPRFKAESDTELSPVLKTMGMEDVLHDADFSGISARFKQTSINEIKHRAVVEVDEIGTVAASGTSVAMSAGAYIPPKSKSFVFRADRPFLFIIEDAENLILFAGVVNSIPPSAAQ